MANPLVVYNQTMNAQFATFGFWFYGYFYPATDAAS